MTAPNEDQSIEYLDRSTQLRLEFCRFYYRIQTFLVRFPRYTRAYYLENISSLPDEEQLRQEKQLWLKWTPFDKSSNTSFILVAYHSLMCLKYFGFIYYMIANVNFEQPDLNLIKVENKREEEQHEFVCLRTNCSKLFGENNKLADDLVRLPVFSICHPQISWFYGPMMDLHQISLILSGIFLLFIFVVSVLAPLMAIKMCLPLRFAAFLVCPNIVHHLELERTRMFCCKLAESFENYQSSACKLSPAGRRLSFMASSRQIKTIAMNHLDCSPINASKWWHQQVVWAFPLTSKVFGSVVFSLVVIFYGWAHLSLCDELEGRHSSYKNATCSLWTTTGDSASVLELDQMSSGYNLYTAGEFCFGLATIHLLCSMALNGFYHSAKDIQININELRFQLDMAIQLADLRLSVASGENHLRGQTTDVSMFAVIRRKLIDNSNFSSGLLITKPLKRRRRAAEKATQLEYRLACEELAFDLLEQFGWSGEVYAEYLEKLQINYWNFAHLIGEHERPLSGLLLLCYIINFGFSLISVYMSRKMLAYQMLTLLVNISAVMTLNVYIASASIVHSQARRLEFKLWSLVALNSSDNNERVRHSNHLAKKQLISMCANGGLALRTFGYNVTYVRIIEVSFWTTSIILLAYTRH